MDYQRGTEALEQQPAARLHAWDYPRGHTDVRRGPRDRTQAQTTFAALTLKLSEETELRPNTIRSSNSFHKIQVFHLQDVKIPSTLGSRVLCCLNSARGLGRAAI